MVHSVLLLWLKGADSSKKGRCANRSHICCHYCFSPFNGKPMSHGTGHAGKWPPFFWAGGELGNKGVRGHKDPNLKDLCELSRWEIKNLSKLLLKHSKSMTIVTSCGSEFRRWIVCGMKMAFVVLFPILTLLLVHFSVSIGNKQVLQNVFPASHHAALSFSWLMAAATLVAAERNPAVEGEKEFNGVERGGDFLNLSPSSPFLREIRKAFESGRYWVGAGVGILAPL